MFLGLPVFEVYFGGVFRGIVVGLLTMLNGNILYWLRLGDIDVKIIIPIIITTCPIILLSLILNETPRD